MVDALVSKAITDLNSIIVHKEAMPYAFIEELRKLSLSFKHIRPVLEDAERRAVTEQPVFEWVLKLKDLAFEADNMMDEWRIAALSSIVQEREGVGSSNKVGNQSLCLHFSGMILGNKLIKSIKTLRKNLDRIVDETTKHNFYAGRSNSSSNNQVKLFSIPEDVVIIGREEEKIEIVNLLLKKPSTKSSEIPVLSIEGVAGLGKTTLARLVYEDQRVRMHFDRRVWVRAFNKDQTQIMEDTYKSVNPDNDDVNHLENLQLKLAEILLKTRNLFVFDDYMIKDSKMWETLKLVLQFSQEGSRILVIPYNETIEKLIQPTYKHQLKRLSSEDSWDLISHKALRGRSTEDCLDIEKIGRKIAGKCDGVPLALKVAGGALQYMKSRLDWDHFLRSETWATQASQTNILPALLLGYYSLTSKLRQCFEYCSITPSSFRGRKDFFVKEWIAHGFVSGDGEKEMEQRGGEYFDELLSRSFFYLDKRDNEKGTNRFRMHDLIHQLARHTARGEVSVVYRTLANGTAGKGHHYLFNGSDNIVKLIESASKSQSLRTLFVIPIGPTCIPSALFQHLRCLRVLDLSYSGITKVPFIIGSIKHLRYLDLSVTKIDSLPMSLTDLCSLQTLRLNYCSLLCSLPDRIDKLVNLRHLELKETKALKNLPEKVRELSSLRTLSKFCISNDNVFCGIKDLEKLNHLQGLLSIRYLDLVSDEEDVRLAKLQEKTNVTDLAFYWGSEKSWKKENEVYNVLENLRPHTNLQKLSISNYRGERFVHWVEEPSFLNLVKIKLHASSCQKLPALGKLPSLVSLHLKRMNEVKKLQEDLTGGKGGFPKLEMLTLWEMLKLTKWTPLIVEEGETATMPCLRKLKVKYCPKLEELPRYFAETLTELTISRCDKLVWLPSIRPVLERLVLEEPAGTLLMELPNLSNLKTLEFQNGSMIKLLPKGLWKLRSLETLIIKNCLQLKTLPEDIQYLTALQQLIISGCSSLTKQCNIGGEEWQKIAFILSIQIDEKNVHI